MKLYLNKWRIKEALELQDKKLTNLSAHMGVTNACFYLWLKKGFTGKQVKDISAYLNVSAKQLMDRIVLK